MRNNKFTGGANGKGYYIALILCAAAIGISGYMYYRNADELSFAEADATVSATVSGEDMQVVATQPKVTQPKATEPVLATEGESEALKTVFPVEGEIISVFSMDALTYNQTTRDWRVHNGVDFAAEEGTQVAAAADGEVYSVYEDETMGHTVIIRHGEGYTTRYASLDAQILVQPGDTVTAGQAIGCVGQSALLESAVGSHLHFSVSCDGEEVDPEAFLNP